MLTAQQARRKDKLTGGGGGRANLPSKLPRPPPTPRQKIDRLGSLSNDGGDGNENVKKEMC